MSEDKGDVEGWAGINNLHELVSRLKSSSGHPM